MLELESPAAPVVVPLRGSLRRLGVGSRRVPWEPLAAQEGPDAGHTIARHGGGPDADVARLRDQPWIGTTGSFTDLRTMERAVRRAVQASAGDVLAWLRAPGGARAPFIREVAFDSQVGSELSQEDLAAGRGPRRCDGLRFVLVRDPSRPTGYHVRTSYPVELPPPPVPLAHHSLAEYEAAGAGHTLARSVGGASPADRLRADRGARVAARFTGEAVAERAVAEALGHWSGAIARWLAGTDPSFVRAYCAAETVGSTLQRAELDSGEEGPMPTPVLLLRLRRDPSFAEGFAVDEAHPVRGF